MQTGPLHEALKPLGWLIGKWTSVLGTGSYPQVKPFTFKEKIEFISIGQPLLNFKSVAWNSGSYAPSHLSSGYMVVGPECNELSFLISHSMGILTLEAGSVEDTKINLRSTEIHSMKNFKFPRVLRLVRHLEYCCETQLLEIVTCMETKETPLSSYLKATYEKEPF